MRRAAAWLKDVLFPRFCVGCKKEGQWLCDDCLFLIIKTERLPAAKEYVPTPHLDRVMALFHYGDNTISRLIQLLKYNSLEELQADVQNIILATDFSLPYTDFTLIPTPLHPRRERERGFNQAMVLAEGLAQKFNLSICMDLCRVVHTDQQAKLSAAHRRTNLNNAFVFDGQGKPVPEKVLLVDDVFTTGATMDECAKTLKAAGAKIVWGLALAHGG